ncbi:MAG: hypothetical protein AAB434_08520 [Planctomycetota bacterium]
MVSRGSVILEALVALSLLAAVLGVVAQATVRQERMAGDARCEVAAREALLAEMERLRTLPFDKVVSAPRASFTDQDLPDAALAVDVAPEGGDDLRRVSVTVSWTDVQKRPRSRSLSTLRARAGGPR